MEVANASDRLGHGRVAAFTRESPVATASMRLYGRRAEQERIDRLIGAACARRSAALVLHGDPGIGKSALLQHALATARGMRVLRFQCDQHESDLAFAALRQLLRPLQSFVAELPQKLAAAALAVLRPDGAGEADHSLIGAAVLALLTAGARQRPLLCVVDDGQWLDRPSAHALSYAARRLDHEGVVVLAAARSGDGEPFEPADVPATWLHGLDAGAARDVLVEHAGPDIAHEVVRHLVEQTGGVPLALVDAAVSLSPAQLAGRASLPRPLPMSPDLRRTVLRPAHRLTPPARRLLLVVAARNGERIDVVAAASARLGIDPGALDEAEASGLVEIDGSAVRLVSRLVEAAVYHEARFCERRTAHLALALGMGDDDDDRRVLHLAAAALERDGSVAARLEQVGKDLRLADRATVLQRAAELTPDGPERGRRLIAAASARWLAGHANQAMELLARADRLHPSPLDGADIAGIRGRSRLDEHDIAGALAALSGGADRVGAISPPRALDLLVQGGEIVAASGDVCAARRVARQAAAVTGDRPNEVASLLGGVERMLDGDLSEAAPLAERAISMALQAGERSGHLVALATTLSAGNDLALSAQASAIDLVTGDIARLRATGAAGLLPAALARLAWLELWADRHRSCWTNATEGLSRARSLGQRWAEASCAMALAIVAAVRGHERERQELVELLVHPPGAQSAVPHAGGAAWASALSDLGAGRYSEALVHLENLAPGGRLGLPWHTLWSRPDAVEAAVRAGRLDAARAALRTLEGAARPGWPAPAAALLARSRALVSTGREAERGYLAALALHAAAERPFQHARTRLLWGEHLRRSRRRVDAREQLRSALDAFERLDARPWAARARAELRATGETVSRGHADADDLTPQEVRIAHLVAQGASNREAAERLYISPRTVGYHLAKIYQKLGVSSRTRLAHVLFEDERMTTPAADHPPQPGLSSKAKAAFRRGRSASIEPDLQAS